MTLEERAYEIVCAAEGQPIPYIVLKEVQAAALHHLRQAVAEAVGIALDPPDRPNEWTCADLERKKRKSDVAEVQPTAIIEARPGQPGE